VRLASKHGSVSPIVGVRVELACNLLQKGGKLTQRTHIGTKVNISVAKEASSVLAGTGR